MFVTRQSALNPRRILQPVILLIIFSGLFLPIAVSASEWLYTVQTGAFSLDNLTGAGKHFMLLSEKLGKKQVADLRIEQTGQHFLVRIGQFSSIATAKELLKKISRQAPEAKLMKFDAHAFYQNEVFIVYDSEAYLRTKKILASASVRTQPFPAVEEGETNGSKNEDLKQQQRHNASEALLDDISRLFENQEHEKAAELIRRGIRQWPDRPEFYAWNGASLLETGRHEEALTQYRKAAELMPNVPEYHAGSGFSLLNIYVDRAKKSMEAFEKALAIDPNNINALEGLGIVYSSTGQRPRAEDLYKRLRELDRDAAARLAEYIRWGIDWRR